MAGPGDIDPFDPLAALTVEDDVRMPWDWVPEAWKTPVEPAPMQPGLGIPQEVVEQAAQQQQAAAAVQPAEPEVKLGFPRVPDEDIAAELAADAGGAVGEPDAISGVGPVPMSDAHPGLGIPAHLVEDSVRGEIQRNLDAGLDPMTGQAPGEAEIEFDPDQLDESDRRQSLAGMSDEEFAVFSGEQAEERRQLGASKALDALIENDRQVRAAREVFEGARVKAAEKRAQLEAESAQLAAEEDAGDSIGKTIVMALMAAAGGLVQHLNQGRNLGLEMVLQAADRRAADMARKRARLDRKRGLVDAELGEARDLMQDETRYRVAALDHTLRIIDAEQQAYDPQGTMAIRLEAIKRQVFGARMKALADHEEREIKRMQAEGKTALEIAEFRRKAEKDRIDAENERKRIGIEGYRAATDRKKAEADIRKDAPGAVYTPEQLAKLNPGQPVPPIPMDQKQYEKWLETQKKGGDAVKVARENSPEERARRFGAGDLVDADGKPLLFRDEAAAARVAKQRGAVDNAVRIIDQLIVARKKYGWSSDLFASDEWRAMQADKGNLIVQLKNVAELGALSGPDMGLVESMMGTKDPTELRDPLAGLEQARSNAINDLNGTIVSEASPGQRPKRYEPPRITAAKAIERSSGQNVDVWDSPLLDAPDEDTRKAAAQDAVDTADALSRQANAGVLKSLARDNAERLRSGAFTQAQHDKVQKALRREWKKRLAAMTPEQRQQFGIPLLEERAKQTDEYLDQQLLAPMGGRR